MFDRIRRGGNLPPVTPSSILTPRARSCNIVGANCVRLCRNYQICTISVMPARVDEGIDPYHVTIKTLCAPVARGFPDALVRTTN